MKEGRISMSVYDVKLKRVVDDSYEIEIGYSLQKKS